MKLICDADPVAIGIEDAQGNWSLEAFRLHIQSCADCGQFASYTMSAMAQAGGGKSRRKLTPEQARAMAQKAVAVRWGTKEEGVEKFRLVVGEIGNELGHVVATKAQTLHGAKTALGRELAKYGNDGWGRIEEAVETENGREWMRI